MCFRRFILSVLMSFVMQMTWAVIAYPGLIDFRQPDGSIVKLKLRGDEFFHWAESEDGYTLMADDDGFMTLAIPDEQGNLCPSKYKAVNMFQRSPAFLDAMKQVKPGTVFSKKQLEKPLEKRMLASSKNRVIVSDKPVVGKRKFLVILMEFADVKFQKSAEDFYRLLNEPGYNLDWNAGSVHDFYLENSFGQLDLQCDVAGVYQASQGMAFYGGNNGGDAIALAIEALQAAGQDYNLGDYDANGDGYIDGVHIIFAGYGEEAGGGADCIWSHESTTTGTFCVVDGIRMNMYSCTPELRNGSGSNMSRIGVICHEIGHALGTMDFYDTNYGTGGNYPGSGQWDVMGSGNWNNDGGSPAHFNPYSKIYDFKWSEIQNGNKPQMITLNEKTKDAFVRIDTQTDGEFFILEYRNNTGFDASIPGHGLMVWRSSEYMSRYRDNTINAFHHQQFYPLCANATVGIPTNVPNSYGNLDSASTPFPGTLGKTSLTDETIPSMRNWNGDPTGLPITKIEENKSDGSVSFMIAGGDGQAYGLSVRQIGIDFLTLDWKNDACREVMLVGNVTESFGIPNSTDYSVGAEIDGGGTVIYVGYDTSFTHDNLEEGTDYYYQLFTRQENGSGWSSPIKQRGQTDIKCIKKYPYYEDFENGVLPTGWSQELVYGTNLWTVQKEWESTLYVPSYVLYFDWAFEKGQRQGTRAIMPSFNFAGHKNALLEFDYRNLLIDMRVVYRSSPDDDWKELMVLDNHYKTGGMMSNYDAYLSEEHAIVPLPDLSEDYQIAFVSDFSWRGNIKTSAEVGTIDNVKVSVDYSPFALTNNPVSVTGTSAEIICTVLPGNETVKEMGVEWSTDMNGWIQVPASNTGEIVMLTGLPKATRIYYRSYLVTAEGRYEGAVLSFETMDPDFEEPEEDKEGANSDFTYRTSNKKAIITGLSSTFNKQSIDVPKELEIDGKTYPVVEIAGYAFAHRQNITSITLHEGLKTIGEEAFNELNDVSTLAIPASVDSICGTFTTHLGAMAALKEISVAEGNGKYCTADGVLFTKDMKTLIKYPAAKSVDEYVIPDGVTSVFSQSFRRCQAKAIVIPESVTKISYLAFDDGNYLNKIICKALVPPEIIADYPGAGLFLLDRYDLFVKYKAIDKYRQSTVWSKAKSINEIPHTLGDVNDDELVDVADAVCIVNDRLGYESTGFIRHWSDINNDSQYTIADAIADISIMYDKPIVSGVGAKVVAEGRENLVLYQADTNTLSLDLNNSQAYSAFQFDISLPEGVRLTDIALNKERAKGFTVQFHQTDDCNYRVVAVNYDNEAIDSGKGNLLVFNVLGLGNMDATAISDIHFSDVMATDVKFEDLRLCGSPTSIGDTENTDFNQNVYYDLSGRCTKTMTDGIYIVNGVKIVRK